MPDVHLDPYKEMKSVRNGNCAVKYFLYLDFQR